MVKPNRNLIYLIQAIYLNNFSRHNADRTEGYPDETKTARQDRNLYSLVGTIYSTTNTGMTMFFIW